MAERAPLGGERHRKYQTVALRDAPCTIVKAYLPAKNGGKGQLDWNLDLERFCANFLIYIHNTSTRMDIHTHTDTHIHRYMQHAGEHVHIRIVYI